MKKKRLIVIDANSIIHRAYHALPRLTTKKGNPVQAIYGFLLVFFKVLKEFQPNFIAACFDFPAPTFRVKVYKEYKAKRPPAPKELYQQIPLIKEVLKAFNVSIFEKEGFEADDLIGTICQLAPKKQVLPEIETIILSGDLDVLQLVNNYTKAYTLRRGVKEAVLYDKAKVQERYQELKPSQLPDFKALKGDQSDNIPGVPGIGEKTAINLIKEFGNLENLYKEIERKSEKIKKIKPKLREILIQCKDQVFFSRLLAQIRKDVPINFNLRKCQFGKYNREKVIKIFKNLEFYSLIKRLPSSQTRVNRKQGKLIKV